MLRWWNLTIPKPFFSGYGHRLPFFCVRLGVLSYSLTQSQVIFLMISHLGPGCNLWFFLLLRVVGRTENLGRLIFVFVFFSTGWAHVNVAMIFILSTVWWFKWFNHHTNTGVSNEWIDIKLSHKINEHVMSFAKPAIWNATSSKNEQNTPGVFPLNYLMAKRGCYAGACKNYCLSKIGPKRGQHLLLNMSQNTFRTDICTAHHISLRSKSQKKSISREAMSMSILHTPVNCGQQVYVL